MRKKIKAMYRFIYFILLLLLAACEPEDWSTPGNLVPPTVDEDSSIPSLSINGTLLHVESYGDPADPLLVVIHGGPGGDFRSLLNAKDLVDDGFFVVFYDQRGTGLSKREHRSQFEGENVTDLFVEDLHALIDHFSPTQDGVFLLGHSWGAMLATAYIDKYPGHIRGAVLAEPGGLTWEQAEEYMSRSNEVKFFNEALNNMLIAEEVVAGRSEHEILDYKASFSANFENAPGNTIGNPGHYPFWRNGAVAAESLYKMAEKHGFDFTANLHAYEAEILLLYSQNNKAYGEAWALEVAAPFPHAKIDVVRNSGHEMLYFGWADMYPKVSTYLKQLK